jgi:hypothetical protein
MIGLYNIANALHGAQQRRQPKTSNLVYLYTDTRSITIYTAVFWGKPANLFHVIRTRTVVCVCVCVCIRIRNRSSRKLPIFFSVSLFVVMLSDL